MSIQVQLSIYEQLLNALAHVPRPRKGESVIDVTKREVDAMQPIVEASRAEWERRAYQEAYYAAMADMAAHATAKLAEKEGEK